ncbi:hypothetical protein [Streptomyces flavofungini]|uniref:hypothetical protein n=1 Tax=Streptomyces flavofungini TaxID=68200 RepID=UPI0025B2688C|nr:hypothetical protein [Streptomyces flavofungini]WJV50649.1 hypothetical protein QUY26_37205 [Streptomyces flavofungini]
MAADRSMNPVGAVLFLPRLTLRAVRAGADALLRELISAVVARIDLDALVARVDVDRVADRVDVDRVAARVDIGSIADRVDVNRIADRVDVRAVIARVDLVPLTLEVLARIDLGRIVRDTGGGMTRETLDALRERSMRADLMVNHLAGRLLRRNGTVRTGEEGGAGPPAGQPS